MSKYKASWLEAGYVPGNLDAFKHVGDRRIRLFEDDGDDTTADGVAPTGVSTGPPGSATAAGGAATAAAEAEAAVLAGIGLGFGVTTTPIGTIGPPPAPDFGGVGGSNGGFVGIGSGGFYGNLASFAPNSGVYAGSLSSLGNMVAMSLSNGSYRIGVVTGGVTSNGTVESGQTFTVDEWRTLSFPDPRAYPTVSVVPYSTGYLRDYWQDPQGTTFGANTAIPALTGVFPDPFVDSDGTVLNFPGNFVYYMDLAMQRLSGSNTWSNEYFMNIFNQTIGWVLTTNSYTAALNNAESNTLSNFGSVNYQDFVTQGFNKYQTGLALRKALGNLGTFVQTIPDGHFGTPNSVVKHIIDNGLGFIGGISDQLTNLGIPYDDIYNADYTSVCANILKGVNNPSQLAIVQQTLKTTLPDIQNLSDYTSIERCSGLVNDSQFRNLAEFGVDIYQKAATLAVETGAGLVLLIDSVQSDVSANVEAITGNSSHSSSPPLLSQTIIDSLRTYLPLGPNGSPVSLVNVIGTASGYYTDKLALVNDGIARLYASEKYGTRIRDTLTNISRYYAGYPLDAAEKKAAEDWVPVPAPVYGVNVTGGTGLDATRETYLVSPGGPSYWQYKLEQEKQAYYALISEIAADTTEEYPIIVAQINENYLWCCRNLYWETTNYGRAGFQVSTFNDKSQYFAFMSSMPQYGADPQNIGTDYILYGLCQSNEAGDIMKTILGQGKTNQLLGEAGVQIKNII